MEAIARCMASDLAAHAVPQEAGAMPSGQREGAAGQMPIPHVNPPGRQENPEGPHQAEYGTQGGPSRLHELLTPSQAQALGPSPLSPHSQ